MIFSFNNDLILYNSIKNKYEYAEDDDPIWNLSSSWIEICKIEVQIKNQGHGTNLLNSFLKSLPLNTGIVLNASPLNECQMSFNELQSWYLKRNFNQINKNNISLFYIKKEKI